MHRYWVVATADYSYLSTIDQYMETSCPYSEPMPSRFVDFMVEHRTPYNSAHEECQLYLGTMFDCESTCVGQVTTFVDDFCDPTPPSGIYICDDQFSTSATEASGPVEYHFDSVYCEYLSGGPYDAFDGNPSSLYWDRVEW